MKDRQIQRGVTLLQTHRTDEITLIPPSIKCFKGFHSSRKNPFFLTKVTFITFACNFPFYKKKDDYVPGAGSANDRQDVTELSPGIVRARQPLG